MKYSTIIEVEKNGTVYQYEYNAEGKLIAWRHRGTEVGCFWSEWEELDELPADWDEAADI